MTLQIKSARNQAESATDRQERIKWWSQDLLRNTKIMVVGAGAIGNEVAKNLALLGVGYTLIADFDEIEISNLSRTALFRREDLGKRKAVVAARRAQEINVEPAAVVEAFDGDVVWDLGLGVYRRMDLILGCLDNIEARLAVNRACMAAGKPFLDGGIRELAGSVYVFAPPFDCCFNCTTTQRERQAAGKRYDSCFQTLKQGYSEGKMANVQITSALIAAILVEQAIKWLHGRLKTSGIRIQYDGSNGVPYFDVTRIYRRQGCDCEQAESMHAPSPIDRSTASTTLRQCLVLMQTAGIREPVIKFPSSFVPFLYCTRCEKNTNVMRPLHRLTNDQIKCRHCGVVGDRSSLQLFPIGDSLEVFEPEMSHYREKLLDRSLESLGFPKLHVIQVQDIEGCSHFFEFSRDEEAVLPELRRRRPSQTTEV